MQYLEVTLLEAFLKSSSGDRSDVRSDRVDLTDNLRDFNY